MRAPSAGAVATAGEIVVSFDRMNRILDFDPTDRLVKCQAGVVTQTLQEFAAQQDLFYPVDFASAGSSQIGGNIATNAGGIKVIRNCSTFELIVGADPSHFLWVFQEIPAVVAVASFPPAPLEIDGA